jgi:chromosome segregation ATPase
MLALQNMPLKDYTDPPPLSNITNSSSPRKSSDDMGAISTQILSLTTICTSLQREMANLSRRSKDNATDLVSLKEATNSRDEDIRKSLRELVQNLNNGPSVSGLFGASLPRANPTYGVSTPPPAGKSFTLPRIPSPSSIFDERVGSPSPFSMDGVASVAMLEKIIREMVTKDGQEHLLSTLSNLFDKASKDSGETAKKVDQMCQQIQKALENQASQALVPCNHPTNEEAPRNLEQASEAGPLTRTTRDVQNITTSGGQSGAGGDTQSSYASPKAADFVGDEMIKLLKKIKESVGQTGGMVGEMKAQQRDLRGEVLHMGRDIARKIDESRKPATGARAIEDGSGKQDIARIVTEGLAELKQHLDNTMRDKRRQSSSTSISRSSVNSQEVYEVVKHSLTTQGLDPVETQRAFDSGLTKEAILEAVKEAYEEYKPDVQVEQFGLEREEILDCLREGLQQYAPSTNDQVGMSREEIMSAIHDAMKDYQPPPPINEANEARDEFLMAVRECLDEFKPSLAVAAVERSPSPRNRDRELDITREVVLDAVKSGLAANGPNAAREIEISRDDLFEAVKAGLESSGSPFGQYGEKVVNQLDAMLNEMRLEFKDYSTANGRDTEQVLDAMNDGLEKLRVDIEQYVDRAQDVTSKDEIIDTIRGGLEHLRRDVEAYCEAGPQGENAFRSADMLNYIKAEFEHLHGAINTQVTLANSSVDKDEILQAIQNGFESLQTNIGSRGFDAEGSDGVNEAMKTEFEQLREAVIGGSSVHKDEVIDMLTSGFDTIHGKIDGGAFASGSSDEDIRAIKEELEHLRETIANTMIRAGGDGGNEEVMDAVRELREMVSALPHNQSAAGQDAESIQVALDALREQLGTDSGATSKEVLDTIQSEFESLRSSFNNTLVRSGGDEDKDEMMQAVRSTLETVQVLANRPAGSIDDELLGAIRGEFEVLRASINNGFSRSTQRADIEDVMDAVRLGFDDLRSELVKKIEDPEPHMKATSELLDALNEGLESLKGEVGSTAGKPIDMTVSYEILDTLKEGIASLRADIEKLKGDSAVSEASASEAATERGLTVSNEIVLAEEGTPASREVPPPVPVSTEILNPNDVQKLEVMLAELAIKFDAMDANISDPAFRSQQQEPSQPVEGTAMKTDLESIEAIIKEMQGSIDIIAARELDASATAKKEDTDAIETLLQNTKAKLDDMVLPDLSNTATKEQLESVETLLKSTREAIDDLSVRVEDNVASKMDVAALEVLVQDLKNAMDEAKAEKAIEDPKDNDQVSKTDVDAVAMIALEIRDKVNAMHNADPENLPSKADVEQLTGLLHDFRDSHEKLKENYESDVQITAKCFDDRKQEAEDTIAAIGVVKSYLADVKEELQSKIDVAVLETTSLTDSFKILEKTIESNFNVTGDVKELMEIVNREFERIHGTVEDVKMTTEQKTADDNEKHAEAKAAVIAEITQKLDEKFDVIMTKYDEAQIAAEAQVKAMEEKTVEQNAILAAAKDVSEELKLSVDTLGMTITAMEARFSETMEKVNEDSQTVFNKIEEGFTKLDDVETRTAAKDEHQLTRDEVAKVVEAINGVSAEATEFHPKFMVTLQEVVVLINQQHEELQKAQESAQEQIKNAHDQSRSLTEEIRSSFTALPALLPAPPVIPEPVEKYDDAHVQEKLDQLMGYVSETKEATNQLDRLDKIHEQVLATAAEVSQFVTSQTRLITEGHESKQKEADEVALLLERRMADKEHLENDIQGLASEKESLLAVIETLRSERDALAAQKARLASNVAALETANAIRKEELHAMENKADALERRILDGIMNQSRVMLMAKGSGRSAPQEASRMASNMSHSTVGQLPPSSVASQGLSMALKARQAPGKRNGGTPVKTPTGRRVMSLNPITNNTPTGAHAYRAAVPVASPGGLMKRSQSVRTPGLRKVSWNSLPDKEKRRISTPMHDDDKENSMISEEHSEDERYDDDDVSESGTERRQSHLTETTDPQGGNSNSSYAGSVSEDDRRTSRGTLITNTDRDYGTGSEYTGTGSYITGSEIDRRTSYGSTVRSTLGAETIDEENSGDGEEFVDASHEEGAGDDAPSELDVEDELADLAQKKMTIFAAPSDSGLGSDVHTSGAMSGSETDYYRRRAEDA